MGRAISKTVMIAELIKVFTSSRFVVVSCFFFGFFFTYCFCLGTQRRIAGLHQNTAIGSTDITDMWEPLEEGLLPYEPSLCICVLLATCFFFVVDWSFNFVQCRLETTRHVSVITVTLSKKELDTSSPG